MVWLVESERASIGFRNMLPSIWGSGTQDFRSQQSGPTNIRGLEAHWSIVPTTASDLDLDLVGDGTFVSKVRDAPDLCHFHIDYYSPDAELGADGGVGFSLALPVSLFDRCFSIWQEIVTRNGQTKFLIAFDVIGFRQSGSLSEMPTAAEWQHEGSLKRKHVYGNDVEFSFHTQN